LKASALTKCSATTAIASNTSPAPGADSHTAAAVVSPCTAPRRVMMMPAPKSVCEAVLADQHDQRRRGTDDRLGPQVRALALDGSFRADERRQPERGEEVDDVSSALHIAAQQGTGQQKMHAGQLPVVGAFTPPQRFDLTTWE
jgi:hypothetical protein